MPEKDNQAATDPDSKNKRSLKLKSMVKASKEIVDVLVVTIGAANRLGILIDPIWDIVQESNMKKSEGPVDPTTGKKMKPMDWEDPKEKIKEELVRQGFKIEDE